MIYVIQSGTARDAAVKIGKTTAARKGKRKKELQVGNPEKLYVIAKLRGGKKREAELHERFSASRIHGEWFRRTHEIQEWLDEIGASLPNRSLVVKELDNADLESIEDAATISFQHRAAALAIILFLAYMLII